MQATASVSLGVRAATTVKAAVASQGGDHRDLAAADRIDAAPDQHVDDAAAQDPAQHPEGEGNGADEAGLLQA